MAKARTTLLIDEVILYRAKERALRRGITLTKLFEEALVNLLKGPVKQSPGNVRLRSHGKGGFYPGIDLADNSALLDLLDGS